MKALFILLLLTITAPAIAQVQKYILTTGTNGYVTVTTKAPADDGTAADYTRGELGVYWYITGKGDTQMAIQSYQNVRPALNIPYTIDSNFQNGDAANGNFPTADSLYRWTRRHLQKYVGN